MLQKTAFLCKVNGKKMYSRMHVFQQIYMIKSLKNFNMVQENICGTVYLNNVFFTVYCVKFYERE